MFFYLPAHRGDETWVKVEESDTLLSHGLELLTEWEWKLGNNETTEDGTDSREHEYVEHTLNIGFDHVSHHIWVLKHCHLVEFNFLTKIACLGSAKV